MSISARRASSSRQYIGRLREKARLIICSGNHDLDSRNESGEKVTRWILNPRKDGVASDGNSIVLGDTLFTICPWWDGPMVRAAIDKQLAADAPKRPDRWIWVHHAPPKTTPISWDGQRYYGDVELEQWIAAHGPDIVFSGHVHQAPFSHGGSWVDHVGSAWVFNAGRQYGAPPTFIVVDLDEQWALWVSAAGNEIVHLDRPLQRPIEKVTETARLAALATSAGRAGGRSPARFRPDGEAGFRALRRPCRNDWRGLRTAA